MARERLRDMPQRLAMFAQHMCAQLRFAGSPPPAPSKSAMCTRQLHGTTGEDALAFQRFSVRRDRWHGGVVFHETCRLREPFLPTPPAHVRGHVPVVDCANAVHVRRARSLGCVGVHSPAFAPLRAALTRLTTHAAHRQTRGPRSP
eukprot:9472268-Pyramimonas_sp.AAC.1